jgi:chromosome segregation ATPase
MPEKSVEEARQERLEECQSRWLNEAMEGYSSDYQFMLNTIYRLQDEIETYKVEQESMLSSVRRFGAQTQELRKDLEAERKNHTTTLNLLEKAIEELVSWREAAKQRATPSPQRVT